MDHADATLVRLALAGDSAAFDELVHRHRPRLVRVVAALIDDSDEAESLAQEALARAYARLADFRDDLPFGAWLQGIGLNLSRQFQRDRARHARPVPPEALGGVIAARGHRQGALSDVLRREAGEHTRAAVSALPELLREAFVLHFVEGMDYAIMSRITATAEGTLRVRTHRARALLRSSLGDVVDTWLREGGYSGTGK